MTWRVMCDFDGTISKYDTNDQLLEQFAPPEWLAIEAGWVAGLINSAQCMRSQVELLDLSKEKLDEWIQTIEIDETFVSFVKFCEQRNIDICITSDGIDYVIKQVLQRYGLNHLRVTANKLVFLENNRYTLQPCHMAGQCESGSGVCKCSIAELNGSLDENILYIGDGRSDFCVSKNVELVMAKSTLLTFCEQHELPHLAFNNFNDVKATLSKLISSNIPLQSSIISPLQLVAV